jgi:hypothetical protein
LVRLIILVLSVFLAIAAEAASIRRPGNSRRRRRKPEPSAPPAGTVRLGELLLS